jgi:hypothetical protein
MTELFRFMLCRPAQTGSGGIPILPPHLRDRTFTEIHTTVQNKFSEGVPTLKNLREIEKLHQVLPTENRDLPSARLVRQNVKSAFKGRALDKVVSDTAWKSDKEILDYQLWRIYDQGSDAENRGPELTRKRQLYDLVEHAVEPSGDEPLKLRSLVVAGEWPLPTKSDNSDKAQLRILSLTPAEEEQARRERSERLAHLTEVMRILNSDKVFPHVEKKGTTENIDKEFQAAQNSVGLVPAWRGLLSADARAFLDTTLPSNRAEGFESLHTWARETTMRELRIDPTAKAAFRKGVFDVGGSEVALRAEWPAPPATDRAADEADRAGVPRGKRSTVRPSGVGDLIVVRDHVWGYEGGEIGSIQNVLRTEKMKRETKRLDRTEQVDFYSEALEMSEERDATSTERFALNQEAASVAKSEFKFADTLSTSFKYGVTVEVKNDLSVSQTDASEQSSKVASQFSKDVTSRAATKVVEKTFRSKSLTTIAQFEENYKHEFDNSKDGATNVAGVYQWVNKVSQSQMYNYGKRLLMDFVVPEPAAALVSAGQSADPRLKEPVELTESAADLHEGNYAAIAARYQATGIRAPPALLTSFSRAFTDEQAKPISADKHIINFQKELQVPKGYLAWSVITSTVKNSGDVKDNTGLPLEERPLQVQLSDITAGGYRQTSNSVQVFDAPFLSSTIGFSWSFINMVNVAGSIRVNCIRSPEIFEKWQLETYDAIATAYLKQKAEYNRAVAETVSRDSFAAAPVSGDNPALNAELIRTELKRAAITLLTSQHFDLFGNVAVDSLGNSEIASLSKAAALGKYTNFVERAFEWENMTWALYPYYWARKETWPDRMRFRSPDPVMQDFVRAGAARVSLPARVGFALEALYFLERGKVWGPGPVLDARRLENRDLADEVLEAEKEGGKEEKKGEPWFTVVPTNLVKLRADDKYPAWKFDAKLKIWREVERKPLPVEGVDAKQEAEDAVEADEEDEEDKEDEGDEEDEDDEE